MDLILSNFLLATRLVNVKFDSTSPTSFLLASGFRASGDVKPCVWSGPKKIFSLWTLKGPKDPPPPPPIRGTIPQIHPTNIQIKALEAFEHI